MSDSETHRAIDAVWRIEAPRLIAGLARIVRDVGIAEELAQDALLAALEQWPQSGVPKNPGAWLMATAKHRALDLLRRDKMLERKHRQLGHELEDRQERAVPDLHEALDDDIGDDLWISSPTSLPSRAIICCPACGEICCTNSAGWTRRGRSSHGRPGSPGMLGNAPSCWNGRPGASRGRRQGEFVDPAPPHSTT